MGCGQVESGLDTDEEPRVRDVVGEPVPPEVLNRYDPRDVDPALVVVKAICWPTASGFYEVIDIDHVPVGPRIFALAYYAADLGAP